MRHAVTSATRAGAFPADEPLEDGATVAAAGLAGRLPRHCTVLTSPAVRCVQTARAAELESAPDDELRECDFGNWAGRTLAEVHGNDPESAATWMADPDAAPHGGESLTQFVQRVSRWLDAQAGEDGVLAAITHAGVIKAAVVHALAAPISSFWRVDAAPLSITELHAHDRRWTVSRVNDAVPV